jgi:hypothetical protein
MFARQEIRNSTPIFSMKDDFSESFFIAIINPYITKIAKSKYMTLQIEKVSPAGTNKLGY